MASRDRLRLRDDATPEIAPNIGAGTRVIVGVGVVPS
jgi:hypothetical protein